MLLLCRVHLPLWEHYFYASIIFSHLQIKIILSIPFISLYHFLPITLINYLSSLSFFLEMYAFKRYPRIIFLIKKIVLAISFLRVYTCSASLNYNVLSKRFWTRRKIWVWDNDKETILWQHSQCQSKETYCTVYEQKACNSTSFCVKYVEVMLIVADTIITHFSLIGDEFGTCIYLEKFNGVGCEYKYYSTHSTPTLYISWYFILKLCISAFGLWNTKNLQVFL